MTSTERCLLAALLNPNLTHSSFRLYAALVILLDGESREVTTAVSVPELKKLLPGVKGKPVGNGTLHEGVRDLQREGLIEVIGPQWSKVSLQVRLLNPKPSPAAERSRLRSALLSLPGWVRVSR